MEINLETKTQKEQHFSLKIWAKIIPFFRPYWKGVVLLFLARLTSAGLWVV